MRFTHDTLPQRVVFAASSAAQTLADEVGRLGVGRLMVIAGEAEATLAEGLVAGLPVALRHTEVVMHVPVEVADRARAAAEEHDVDALVSIGGGSTTGLAKAVALTSGLPIVAVPTTYAGSEATAVWGLTEGGRKTTGADPRVLPRVIVYDATLLLTLPVGMSVASGLNALAHCVDSMWAPRTDPVDQALAVEGIRALRSGLPEVVRDPRGLDGRERTLCGAYLAAVAFASAGSGAAPQDLSRAGRDVRPAARPDPCGRAAVRARLQRALGTGRGAAHGGGLRRAVGAGRAAAAAGGGRRAARAARLRSA